MFRDSLDARSLRLYTWSLQATDALAKAKGCLAMAYDYAAWGWADSTVWISELGLSSLLHQNASHRPVYFLLLRQQALMLGGRSQFSEALTRLYSLLKMAEQYGDTATVASTQNTLGSVALARGQLAEARQWFTKALATCPALPAVPDVRAAILTNTANLLVNQQQEEAATPLLTEALALAQKANNLNIEATALRIKSQAHLQQGANAAAEESLLAMFAVRNRIHQISVQNDEYLQLAAFYETNGQLDKAIEVCLRQIKQGSIHSNGPTQQLYTNEIKLRLPYYEALATYYGKLGNKEEQIKYLQEANAAKDSLYAANTAEAIATLNTQYEVQKKENLIMQQQLAMNRQNMMLYGSLMLAGFAAILGTVLFWQYKKRQRERLQHALAEEKRLAEAAVKQAEENERKRIAADLHDNLGAYGAALNANIETLSGQIDTHSAPLQQIQTNVRSIVSEIGNTIWVLQKEAQELIDVFDKAKRWAQQLADNYPAIQLQFAEKYEQDWMLTPTQALHIYHLLQESINNACKHSGASIITVRLKADAGGWQLSVTDNGRGFDPRAPHHGNGIRHLHQRAAQAALQLQINSGPGGTQVVLLHAATPA